jgi:hypothetical protein
MVVILFLERTHYIRKGALVFCHSLIFLPPKTTLQKMPATCRPTKSSPDTRYTQPTPDNVQLYDNDPRLIAELNELRTLVQTLKDDFASKLERVMNSHKENINVACSAYEELEAKYEDLHAKYNAVQPVEDVKAVVSNVLNDLCTEVTNRALDARDASMHKTQVMHARLAAQIDKKAQAKSTAPKSATPPPMNELKKLVPKLPKPKSTQEFVAQHQRVDHTIYINSVARDVEKRLRKLLNRMQDVNPLCKNKYVKKKLGEHVPLAADCKKSIALVKKDMQTIIDNPRDTNTKHRCTTLNNRVTYVEKEYNELADKIEKIIAGKKWEAMMLAEMAAKGAQREAEQAMAVAIARAQDIANALRNEAEAAAPPSTPEPSPTSVTEMPIMSHTADYIASVQAQEETKEEPEAQQPKGKLIKMTRKEANHGTYTVWQLDDMQLDTGGKGVLNPTVCNALGCVPNVQATYWVRPDPKDTTKDTWRKMGCRTVEEYNTRTFLKKKGIKRVHYYVHTDCSPSGSGFCVVSSCRKHHNELFVAYFSGELRNQTRAHMTFYNPYNQVHETFDVSRKENKPTAIAIVKKLGEENVVSA